MAAAQCGILSTAVLQRDRPTIEKILNRHPELLSTERDVFGWDIDNEWTGPYANSHTNMTEIQAGLDLLWRNDVKADKVVFGMSYYTRSFTLVDPSCNTPGSTVASAGVPGRCSATTGVLLHAEIEEMVQKHGVTPVLHRDAAVKTASWGNQWVSFDDAATWRLKSNIIRGQCISGVMVWAISQDDSAATNAKALTSAVGRTVMEVPNWTLTPIRSEDENEHVDTCRWVGCGKNCPSGWKEVKREGTDQIMSDHTYCYSGIPDKFCCPADAPMPKCQWRGHKNTGTCSPWCNDDEVTVGSLETGCSLRHQSACCTNVASTKAYGECKWVGSAPTCKLGGAEANCPSDYPKRIFSTSRGAGGEKPCVSGSKSYCCKDPSPPEFTNCGWTTPERLGASGFCPEGKIKLATKTNDSWGMVTVAYCCDPPAPKIQPRDETDPMGFYETVAFSNLLHAHAQNPTCPAKELRISSVSSSTATTPAARSLWRRAASCTLDDFQNLVMYATLMITIGSPAMDI